jgi:hypothetical protein
MRGPRILRRRQPVDIVASRAVPDPGFELPPDDLGYGAVDRVL